MATGLVEPFPGKYDANDPFGNIGVRDPNGPGHLGSDWVVPAGSLAPAISNGVIVNTGTSEGNGGYLTLSIGDTGLFAGYIHSGATGTSGTRPQIPEGTVVQQGQLIFVTGDAGRNSHGAHLHITISDSPEAWQGLGKLIDPYAYITGHLGPGGTKSNIWVDENFVAYAARDGEGNLHIADNGFATRSDTEANAWRDPATGKVYIAR
jgi:murein DD-endopeptidase MepM/ murein hydrolase activator NlpD